MYKMIYTEMMILCILVMMVIYISDIKSTRGPVLTSLKFFRVIVIANIVVMIMDMCSVVMNNTSYGFSKRVMMISIFLYYFFHSLISSFYLMYVDFSLYPDKERLKRRLPFILLPLIILEITVILSIHTKWYFYIDEYNVYHRGDLYLIPTIVSFGYILYSLVLITSWWSRNRTEEKRQKELIVRLTVVALIPCFGAIIQALVPGSTSTLLCTTLAIFVNYLSVQNSQMAKDHLTGLYNRSQLEYFMNYQIKNLKVGKAFFLILIDLDGFKGINDTYGHITGDDALISMANLMRRNCKRKKDYVSRLGGDEFVIIGQCRDVDSVGKIISRLHEAVDEFNEKAGKVYDLAFSAGYFVCNKDEEATLDLMISKADEKMYEEKNKKIKKTY